MLRVNRRLGLCALAVALGVVAAVLPSCGTPAPAPTPEVVQETVIVRETVVVPATPEVKEPIRVGLGQPFTGPVAWVGEDYNRGLTLAAEEINLEGGILGHPVQVIPCDNEANPEKAIACVRRLAEQDNVDIIFGMGSSSTALAAMPLMEELQVPFLDIVSAVQMTEKTGRAGGNIWAFRMGPHDGMMAEAFADYVAQGAKTISMYAWNNAYGRGAVEVMKPLLEAKGVEILSEDYFEAGQPDHRPVITRIKGLNPEAVYLVMEARDGSVFMRQYRELGMTAKVFSRGSLVSAEFLDAVADDPSLGEGIMECTFVCPLRDPDYQQRALARWGRLPHAHETAAYVALRYVISAAVQAAIEDTGEVTRSSIRDALENVSVETAVYGTIEFDEYNQAHPVVPIQKIENGEIVLVEVVPTE